MEGIAIQRTGINVSLQGLRSFLRIDIRMISSLCELYTMFSSNLIFYQMKMGTYTCYVKGKPTTSHRRFNY